jgi:hypothetical protein
MARRRRDSRSRTFRPLRALMCRVSLGGVTLGERSR